MSWRYKLNACDTRLMRETWHHSEEGRFDLVIHVTLRPSELSGPVNSVVLLILRCTMK